MNATAHFRTDKASRYLASLCKHFAHKVPVTQTAQTGRVEFPFGSCDLSVRSDLLTFVVSAPDPVHVDKVMGIVTSHLERFAFRENPTLSWQTSTGDEPGSAAGIPE